MTTVGLIGEVLPVGAAVILPLSVALYGWRMLGAASAAAGAVKLALGVAVGVALEALRRALSMSYGEVGAMLVDGATWGIDALSGVVA